MSFPILDLPTEVISHIVSFVSHKKDRRNLALLSKRFYDIVRHQSKHNCLNQSLNLLDEQKNFSSLLIYEQIDEFSFHKLSLRSAHVGEYQGIWLRHGTNITQITLMCKLEEFGAFGFKLKELFPNLKTLIQQNDPSPRVMTSVDAKNFFSENIEELHLNCDNRNLKMSNSTLELFPGLKRLKLTISMTNSHGLYEAHDLTVLLNKWLRKLENIELSFESRYNHPSYLLDIFYGRINEKLSFEFIKIFLTRLNILILKNFLSITRHIKSLEIQFTTNTALDSNLWALIYHNATIDRLTISGAGLSILWVERLINLPGVKEIHIATCVPSITDVRFTFEALLKVKEICISNAEDLLNFHLCRNLRKLHLYNPGGLLMNGNFELIANNFPFLEHLHITNLNATNGHPLANLKHLRSLELSNSPSLADAFFDFGAKLLKLETLSFYQVNLSLAGIKSIATNCPQIKEIKFVSCTQMTEECVDFIAKNLFYIERIYLIRSVQLYSLKKSLRERYPKLIHF